tara:strand:+ start:1205 stop:1366 length:162 start_codon:yes stop_codon:yes gene_type:complete
MYKRAWGSGTMRYCPINKVCWSISKGNKLNVYKDMPTYGLEREELPKNLKQGE